MKLYISGIILIINCLVQAQDQRTVDSLINILFNSRDIEKVNTYNQLSYIHLGSDPNSSRYYADEAVKLAQNIGYKKGMADANRYLGLNCYNQANYPEALSYYHKSLGFYEDIDNRSGTADLLNNIAIILDDQQQYDAALEYYNKALRIYEYLKDKPGVSTILMNLGVTFYNKGDYQKALDYYNKSLEIDKQINDYEGIANCYNNIGEIHLKRKEFPQAIYFYESSLQIMRKRDNTLGIVLCLVNLGDACNAIQDYSRALQYNNEGLTLATRINSRDDMRLIYENLAESYAGLNDYKKAYYYHKLFKDVSDSIFNEKNMKNLHELHEKYEHQRMRQQLQIQRSKMVKNDAELKRQITLKFAFIISSVLLLVMIFVLGRNFEQKRKMNLLLEQQNAEILTQKEDLQQTAEMLTEANATKDKLFSIIAHDLRSPFTSLVGYSQLLTDNIESLSKEEITEFAQSINYSSKIVHNLLDNLLIWSRFQNGKISFTPSLFDFNAVVKEISELFRDVAHDKKISIINSVYPGFYLFADKKMIETVLRNLVSNAIKFTMEGGSVDIIATRKENDVIISVEDNGIGITPDFQKKLFTVTDNLSTYGTNKEQGTGLGLLICKEFVDRHQGSIWVQSQPGKGSIFSFLIPDQNHD